MTKLVPRLDGLFARIVIVVCQVYCAVLILGVVEYRAQVAAGFSQFTSRPPVQSYLLAAAIAVGLVVPGRFLHPYRIRGLLPVALPIVAGTLYFCVGTEWSTTWPMIPLGVGLGTIQAVCIRFRTNSGRQIWWLVGLPGLFVIAPGLLRLYHLLSMNGDRMWGYNAYSHPLDGSPLWEWLVVVGVALGFITLVLFRRPFVELVLEVVMRLAYRLRKAGPGVGAVPARGPCLVIANHAAYLDPVFVADVAPRPIAPMMTALFYDKPGIRQLMRYIFDDTIRVPETPMKRDTAELDAAIAALDAGKCVVIFPEGYLRRKEEQPLRRFGRGVWEILRAKPDTPVVACWIEGSWGSYFSFKDGPPTKNKPRDFRRPIDVGVSAPEVVPAGVLADHIATRFHLMNLVIGARKHLGLPDLPAVAVPMRDEERGE